MGVGGGAMVVIRELTEASVSSRKLLRRSFCELTEAFVSSQKLGEHMMASVSSRKLP